MNKFYHYVINGKFMTSYYIFCRRYSYNKKELIMKVTKAQLREMIAKELKAIKYSLSEAGEYDVVRPRAAGAGADEPPVQSADTAVRTTQQLQNVTKRVHQIEKALQAIGGMEQLVKITKRVYALEQALKKQGAQGAANEPGDVLAKTRAGMQGARPLPKPR
jgi:uncharacterized Fe-S center protein